MSKLGLNNNGTIGALLRGRDTTMPEKIFLTFPDDRVSLTFHEVLDDATRLAWGLRGLGLSPGDRVALALPNGAHAVVGWFACLLSGLVDTAVNADLTGAPLEYSLEKVGASAIVTDGAHLGAILASASDRPVQVVCAQRSDGPAPDELPAGSGPVHDLAELAGNASPVDLVEAEVSGLASIRFTSGSTGMPKGIMMSQGHMRASAQMFGVLTGLDAEDVLYSCFPLHHVLASITGVLAALEAGCTMSLAAKFSARKYWPHVRQCQATVAHTLDPVIGILMKSEPAPSDRDNSVRCMYTAAGSYPEFEERFATQLIPLFDMSELTVVAHYREGEARRVGSCGRESDLFSVAVVDEGDEVVETPRTVGEIVVRPKAPNVMHLGYYGDADKTVQQWQNLWFHTGDMGFLDEGGYLYFTGRSADRIRHRGVNVSPEQIETMMLDHPAIAECAAIAVPSDVSEDDIKVCVVLAPGTGSSVEELGDWVAQALPDHLRPRYLELYGALPRTETSKIRKGMLRSYGVAGQDHSTWDTSQRSYV